MHSRALTFLAGLTVTTALVGSALLLPPQHPPHAARPTGGRNPGTALVTTLEWFNMKQQRDQAFQAFVAGVQQHNDQMAALAHAARQPISRPRTSELPVCTGPGAGGGTTAPTSTDEAAFAACVAAHESGGSYTARNPSSSAAGKYQFEANTWQNYGGYASAADAPPAVQDAKFHQVYNGGAGARAWHGTGCAGS